MAGTEGGKGVKEKESPAGSEEEEGEGCEDDVEDRNIGAKAARLEEEEKRCSIVEDKDEEREGEGEDGGDERRSDDAEEESP